MRRTLNSQDTLIPWTLYGMDVAEELETVQSIFMEDLTHKKDGRDYTLSFSVEGQPVLTLLLKPGVLILQFKYEIDVHCTVTICR